MPHDELDRWLADDEAIVPSSGFAASVMDAVRSDANARHALPFPWRRMLPGAAALAIAIVAIVTSAIGFGTAVAPTVVAPPTVEWAAVLARPDLAWIVAAIVVTVVLPVVSVRLVRLL